MENEIGLKYIESRIFNIRGLQVMMDSDLAAFYETETKYINRAFQGNIERFPESFCFQLTMQEWADLRFQIGTLEIAMRRGGHRNYLPKLYGKYKSSFSISFPLCFCFSLSFPILA
jgi:hypothetical protein